MVNLLTRKKHFTEAADSSRVGKHRSQGPPGSLVYNDTARKTGNPGKHAMNYDGTVKSYSGPGRHSAGYTGKRRNLY